MAMLNNSLSHAGSAAWPQRHRVEMWCVPHAALQLQEGTRQPMCIQEHTQAGRSLEQATGPKTQLPRLT